MQMLIHVLERHSAACSRHGTGRRLRKVRDCWHSLEHPLQCPFDGIHPAPNDSRGTWRYLIQGFIRTLEPISDLLRSPIQRYEPPRPRKRLENRTVAPQKPNTRDKIERKQGVERIEP
jgi:hypothetical protein